MVMTWVVVGMTTAMQTELCSSRELISDLLSLVLGNPGGLVVSKEFADIEQAGRYSSEVIEKLVGDFPQLDKDRIDDLIVGNAMPEAEQGLNVARLISLMGLNTDKVPGVTVNRYCASGSEAIALASAKIQTGMADCIIAGVRSMSYIFYEADTNRFPDLKYGKRSSYYLLGMGSILPIAVPEAYGGLGMGFVTTVMACDYLSGATGSLATAYGAHTGIAASEKMLSFQTLLSAIRLLEINERWDAAQLEPLTKTENKEAFERIKKTDFSKYPYASLLILGAGPQIYGQKISPLGMLRSRQALRAYQKGLVPFIIVSGGRVHPFKTQYIEAVEMKRYMIDVLGIPSSAIIIDPFARHTTTNVRNAGRMIMDYGFPKDKWSFGLQ
ncbi:hypothetical protein FQR65_LT18018 [Abscondita terminalis]|nr:hypothetical protein FQR65_LT18018 [Abscondita terminalis]